MNRPIIERGASLELSDVSCSFGRIDAVSHVSLAVDAGEFITLLGPSGSGKTTTLNIVAGFVQPTGGDVRVDGRSIEGIPAHRRDMGMVFQNYALFPHMSVGENVAFPLRERRLPKQEIAQRVRQALQLVRLDGYEGRRPDQLSGGQQQRVALARAIVFSPRILLMDEPLGALDRKLRENLQIEIRKLQQTLGLTVLFVTHDQEEALALSDRIAVFRGGRIEQIGTPRELWSQPATPFIAAFLGGSNLIAGQLAADGLVVNDATRLRVSSTSFQTGDRLTLLVRPEHLHVSASECRRTDDANSVSGTIVGDTFLGSMRRLDINSPGLGSFVAIEPAAAFSQIGIGQSVAFSWHPTDALLLKGVDPSLRYVDTLT